jgi:hypothetical protein
MALPLGLAQPVLRLAQVPVLPLLLGRVPLAPRAVLRLVQLPALLAPRPLVAVRRGGPRAGRAPVLPVP